MMATYPVSQKRVQAKRRNVDRSALAEADDCDTMKEMKDVVIDLITDSYEEYSMPSSQASVESNNVKPACPIQYIQTCPR